MGLVIKPFGSKWHEVACPGAAAAFTVLYPKAAARAVKLAEPERVQKLTALPSLRNDFTDEMAAA